MIARQLNSWKLAAEQFRSFGTSSAKGVIRKALEAKLGRWQLGAAPATLPASCDTQISWAGLRV